MNVQKFMFEILDTSDSNNQTIANSNTEDNTPAEPEVPPAPETQTQPEPAVPSMHSFTSEQLETIRLESFEKGKAEAISQQETNLEQHKNQLLESIHGLLTEWHNAIEPIKQQYEQETTGLALAIAKKLTASILSNHAEEALMAAITESIQPFAHEPQLTVLVPTEHVEFVSGQLKTLLQEHNATCNITIEGDDTLSQTDCKISWANGHLIHSQEQLLNEIESIIEKTVSTPPITKNDEKKLEMQPQ